LDSQTITARKGQNPMNEPQTIATWVSGEIDKIFLTLAEKVATEDSMTTGMSPDEIAGIPFILNAANLHLRAAWENFTGEQHG
jgi:hypothetical protein